MPTKVTGTEGLDHLFGRPNRRREPGGPASGRAAGGESPSLRDLRRQFEDTGGEATRLAGGLSPKQFSWRPGSGRWSISDCFAHLNIVGSEMLPVIDSAVGEARSRGWYSGAPFRPRVVGRWVLRSTEPPIRRKRRALERHVGSTDQIAADSLAALVDLHELLAGRIQAAAGLDLSRPRVSAPVATVFRLSLFELFLFLAAHERRHLAQARAVREDPLFPRSSPGPEHARPAPAARPPR